MIIREFFDFYGLHKLGSIETGLPAVAFVGGGEAYGAVAGGEGRALCMEVFSSTEILSGIQDTSFG